MSKRAGAARCEPGEPRRRSLVVGSVLAGAATAGGLAGLSGVTAAIAADAVVDVEIKGNLFVPEAVTITPGTTVRWTNHERRTTHSVLFPAESLESERLLPGDSWQRKFDKPGRHPYTCGPHAEMKGLVVAEQVPFPPK